jgi:hypothetical protein
VHGRMTQIESQEVAERAVLEAIEASDDLLLLIDPDGRMTLPPSLVQIIERKPVSRAAKARSSFRSDTCACLSQSRRAFA